jgi:hypothetical protein
MDENVKISNLSNELLLNMNNIIASYNRLSLNCEKDYKERKRHQWVNALKRRK